MGWKKTPGGEHRKKIIPALVLSAAVLAGTVTCCGAAGADVTADKTGLYGYSDYMIRENINPEVFTATFWRIDNESAGTALPRNFRTALDELSADNAKDGMDAAYIPSSEGLADVPMSGSGQFDEDQLDALAAEIRQYHDGTICIVDLRQESHVFVNGRSLSRYGLRDWGNLGLGPAEIASAESDLVNTVSGLTIDAYTLDDDKQPQEQELITAESVQTEEEAAQAHGFAYYRLPCTDHVCPTAEEIDAFVDFVKGLDGNTWLHFHCEAGKGRTTYFMALYDMMCNPDVSLQDIAYRQCELGGNYILTDSGDDWKDPYYAEKAVTAGLFYQYVQENCASDYETPYSEWVSGK